MKRKAMGLLAIAAMALAGGQACSDSNGGISLGSLTTPLFTAASITGALNTICTAGSAACDGTLESVPNAVRVAVDTSGDTAPDDTYTITIGGTACDFTAAGGDTNATVEAGLIANINSAASGCDVTATATASPGSVLVEILDPTDTTTTIVSSRVDGGDTAAGATTDTTEDDLDALVDLLVNAITTPDVVQDLIDCAQGATPASWTALECTGNDFIPTLPATGLTARVTVSVSQSVNCNGTNPTAGTITTTNTITATIDDTGTVDQTSATGGAVDSTEAISFNGCTLTGDLGVASGSASTEITLNGSGVFIDHSGVTPLSPSDPDTGNFNANVVVTTDLTGAGGAAFWTDQINVNARFSDDNTTMEADGGFCFGSAVRLGGGAANDNTIDTDDDCATAGDTFIPITAIP